jgi:hypothetical protein
MNNQLLLHGEDQYYNLLHDDGLRKKAEILTPPTIFLRKKFKIKSTLPILHVKIKTLSLNFI